MKITLYLHVGAGKTASSAIQKFLHVNATTLEASGIYVPDNSVNGQLRGRGQHVMYCGSLLQNRATAGERLKEDLARIVAKKPDCKSIVLSAENLSNPSGFPTIFEEISEIYDIRIIFYIRRQDDYLISAWQQWYCKIYSDFNSWAKADWFRANWELVCRDWEKVVPLDRRGLFRTVVPVRRATPQAC